MRNKGRAKGSNRNVVKKQNLLDHWKGGLVILFEVWNTGFLFSFLIVLTIVKYNLIKSEVQMPLRGGPPANGIDRFS